MRWWLVLLAACSSKIVPSHEVLDAPPTSSPPVPAGCVTDVSPGDHTFTCGGLTTDVRIPAACEAPGCGLILELHGDTGTGLLMDAHTQLRGLGEQDGYIVVAPTGPPWPGGPARRGIRRTTRRWSTSRHSSATCSASTRRRSTSPGSLAAGS